MKAKSDRSGLRRQVVEAARSFTALGLGVGTSGNISARTAQGFLVTPSGVPYDRMKPSQLVLLDGNGTVISGRLAPSSEWRFHRDIYAARPEAGAVVHVHSPFATAVACTRRGIPAFHYMVAVAGGDSIRCAPYATFGTARLSRNALRALAGRQACLLANHGMITLGTDLRAALRLAQEVEELARQYWLASQLGRPVLLGKKEMKTVLERFRHYGASERGRAARVESGKSDKE